MFCFVLFTEIFKTTLTKGEHLWSEDGSTKMQSWHTYRRKKQTCITFKSPVVFFGIIYIYIFRIVFWLNLLKMNTLKSLNILVNKENYSTFLILKWSEFYLYSRLVRLFPFSSPEGLKQRSIYGKLSSSKFSVNLSSVLLFILNSSWPED